MLIYIQVYGQFDMQIITNDYAIIIKSISPSKINHKCTGSTWLIYLFKPNQVDDLQSFLLYTTRGLQTLHCANCSPIFFVIYIFHSFYIVLNIHIGISDIEKILYTRHLLSMKFSHDIQYRDTCKIKILKDRFID